MKPKFWSVLLFLLIANLVYAQKRVYSVIDSRMKKVDTFSVYFDVRDSLLNPKALNKLDSIAASFKKVEKVDLFGFADQRGENNANFQLSQKRASSVKKYLLGKGLIDSQINCHNKGVSRSGNTVSALDKSRRVDIILNSSIPCTELNIQEQLYSFHYQYEYIQMNDSNLTTFNKIIDLLLKNRCLKAVINTHKICLFCQKKDKTIHLDLEKIEAETSAEARKEALYQMALSRGVYKNQIEAKCVQIGCFSVVQKSFQLGNTEEIYTHQCRVDIHLIKR